MEMAGPYCVETVEKLNILHIGPIHSVNNVGVETTDQDIRDNYNGIKGIVAKDRNR